MVEIGRAGGGLIGTGMAQVFRDALLANSIPARKIVLQRNISDTFDTHVTVEVWVDGKWKLFDPIFHIALRKNDERIGAFAARDWFIKGQGRRVELEFLGEVKYPARVTTYPIRYEIHLNNVYVDRYRDIGIVGDIPIVGRWLSRELAYPIEDRGLSTMAQDFYRFLYYTTLVVLPVINLLLLLTMWLIWRKARGNKR